MSSHSPPPNDSASICISPNKLITHTVAATPVHKTPKSMFGRMTMADLEEAKTQENVKRQSALQKLLIQFKETKEMLLKECEDAKKAAEVPIIDHEVIYKLTAFNEKLKNQDSNDHMAYWLSNTNALWFLMEKTLKPAGSVATTPVHKTPKSLFGRMTVGFCSSPVNITAASAALVVRKVEAKYPALLFKQQLISYVEKIYGNIRGNLEQELGSLLSWCIQLQDVESSVGSNSVGDLASDAEDGDEAGGPNADQEAALSGIYADGAHSSKDEEGDGAPDPGDVVPRELIQIYKNGISFTTFDILDCEDFCTFACDIWMLRTEEEEREEEPAPIVLYPWPGYRCTYLGIGGEHLDPLDVVWAEFKAKLHSIQMQEEDNGEKVIIYYFTGSLTPSGLPMYTTYAILKKYLTGERDQFMKIAHLTLCCLIARGTTLDTPAANMGIVEFGWTYRYFNGQNEEIHPADYDHVDWPNFEAAVARIDISKI